MPEPAALLPFVLLGLLGSVHCAGMCGGFALGVAAGGPRGRALGRLGLYALGKALTYAALGLLAARAAHAAHVTEGGPALAGQEVGDVAVGDVRVVGAEAQPQGVGHVERHDQHQTRAEPPVRAALARPSSRRHGGRS